MYVIALFGSVADSLASGSGAEEQIWQCLSVHSRDVATQHGASELYVTIDAKYSAGTHLSLVSAGLETRV